MPARQHHPKQYVLIIPDGAADLRRINNRTPLALAETPGMDEIAKRGISGLMQTLYSDLPKGSLVAQLGMLGWDPRRYHPHGRASLELLALGNHDLGPGDLAFRANLVLCRGNVLVSYSANNILTPQAQPLIDHLQSRLHDSGIELLHNLDFRNTLIFRDGNVDPRDLICPEPHENEGNSFDFEHLIQARTSEAQSVADRLNHYLALVAERLIDQEANRIFPWSPSQNPMIDPFSEVNGFAGRAAIVGRMDFLNGLAQAGGIDFFGVGDGSVKTDFSSKGRRVIELLAEGYQFVVCHINAPDEAAHMGDFDLKIHSLQRIDQDIIRPVVDYFFRHPNRLGSVGVAPDHYTNTRPQSLDGLRVEAHSTNPVPFTIWDGQTQDRVEHFTEDDATAGRYGEVPINHLELMTLLGVACNKVATVS